MFLPSLKFARVQLIFKVVALGHALTLNKEGLHVYVPLITPPLATIIANVKASKDREIYRDQDYNQVVVLL